jgi:arabinofuranosyltransferase
VRVRRPSPRGLAGGLLLAVLAVVLVRCAWIADDAYISLRVVENALAGRGLTWNVDERVQVFTHPLWLLPTTAACAVTRELPFTVFALQLAISLCTAAVLAFGIARTTAATAASLALLIVSKPFVDYSTSGLENPLSHLLLVVLLLAWFRSDGEPGARRVLALAGGLAVLNRLDLALVVAPPLAARLLSRPDRSKLAAVVLAVLPLAAWLAFSVVYYGFAWPNTAYAKLGTGLTPAELAPQGLLYARNLVTRSPITAIVILAGLLEALRRPRATGVLGLGILLYLAYTVCVGGDFMSGRFFTVPFVCGLALLARGPLARPGWKGGAVVAALLVAALAWPRCPLWSGRGYGSGGAADWDLEDGITDERAVYYPSTGLLNVRWGARLPDHHWVEEGNAARLSGQAVVYQKGIGLFALAAGPTVHVVDAHALADPLLARLPLSTERWRIGHFVRNAPRGYLETLASGRNEIQDPDLARFYDRLSLVVRGRIFSRERFRAILDFQLGRYDHFVKAWVDRRRARRESSRGAPVDPGAEGPP